MSIGIWIYYYSYVELSLIKNLSMGNVILKIQLGLIVLKTD